MLFKTGLINIDFATLRQAFHQQRGGKTLFGLGEGSGENCVADAIASLKLCPLLHTPEFSRKADRLLVNIVGGTDLTLPKVNEIMSSVTEQFGREAHIIMGAVIDEAMQGRVEICVLGTSDMGGRAGGTRQTFVSRRPRAREPISGHAGVISPGGVAPAPASEAALQGATAQGAAPSSRSTIASGEAKAAALAKVQQEEFGFGELESRGYFEKTDRNLFDGQDLDVPTYLRKGIKIVL
jgi:cell division protein FtsZ